MSNRKYKRGLLRATYSSISWFTKQPIKIHPLLHKNKKRRKKLFRGAIKRVKYRKQHKPLKRRYKKSRGLKFM